MRKKLDEDTRRGSYIGIKVQPLTKAQLKYIATREATQVSTLIDKILKEYAKNYFDIAKIKWEEIPPEEKE